MTDLLYWLGWVFLAALVATTAGSPAWRAWPTMTDAVAFTTAPLLAAFRTDPGRVRTTTRTCRSSTRLAASTA